MAVLSIRISHDPVHDRLRDLAQQRRVSLSALAERLIDEGLRMEAHPAIVFRDGPAGRRPVLAGGPEVVDVIGSIVGGDVPTGERRSRAAELFGVGVAQVDAALAYYAEFTDEIDAQLALRRQLADRAEASWRRQQALLER